MDSKILMTAARLHRAFVLPAAFLVVRLFGIENDDENPLDMQGKVNDVVEAVRNEQDQI